MRYKEGWFYFIDTEKGELSPSSILQKGVAKLLSNKTHSQITGRGPSKRLLMEFIYQIKHGHDGFENDKIEGKDKHCWWVDKESILGEFKNKPTKEQIQEALIENEI